VVHAALGKAHHQPQVGLRQFLLGAPAPGLAQRDRFERARKFAGRNLGPALDRLNRLLRRFDRVAISSRFSPLPLIFSKWPSSAAAASCRSCHLLRPVASS
jgi:hypothetical protein